MTWDVQLIYGTSTKCKNVISMICNPKFLLVTTSIEKYLKKSYSFVTMTQSTKDQITSWFTLVSVICEIKCWVILYKFFCWDQQKILQTHEIEENAP